MSSESEASTTEMQSMLERLISSRNREMSMFLPFLLGFSGTDPDPTRDNSGENTGNPDHNSGNNQTPDEENQRERIVLINPQTQGMVVIEGTGFDALFRGIQAAKDGQPPASKSAIDALPRVEIKEGDDGGDDDDHDHECVICLEKCCVGETVIEMPCKHRFHGPCVEKWLNLHGSCPVCRFKLPVEEEESGKKRDDEEGRRSQSRREVWVSFAFGRGRRRTEEERESGSDSNSDNQE